MSWADVLYNENPGRRQHLAELCGELKTYTRQYISTTNRLIDLIEEHLPGQKFHRLSANENDSIGDNLKKVKDRVKEIQTYLEQKASELRKLLGDDLFNNLVSPKTSVSEIFAFLRKWTGPVLSVIGSIAGIVLCVMITKGMVLVRLSQQIGIFATCFIAGIGLGVLGLAIDLIISAVVGSQEKKQLLAAIADCKKAKDILEPGVNEYMQHVAKMGAILEMS